MCPLNSVNAVRVLPYQVHRFEPTRSAVEFRPISSIRAKYNRTTSDSTSWRCYDYDMLFNRQIGQR